MSEEYPLYPSLTEHGEKEAQRIMDSFKPKILALVSELMDDLYSEVSMYVESDHWSNYRNELLDGFKGYNSESHEHDFKELRQAIYTNNKEAIDKDLNQDLLKEIEDLKATIERQDESIQTGRY